MEAPPVPPPHPSPILPPSSSAPFFPHPKYTYHRPVLLDCQPASCPSPRPNTNQHWPSTGTPSSCGAANVLYVMFVTLLASDTCILPVLRASILGPYTCFLSTSGKQLTGLPKGACSLTLLHFECKDQNSGKCD